MDWSAQAGAGVGRSRLPAHSLQSAVGRVCDFLECLRVDHTLNGRGAGLVLSAVGSALPHYRFVRDCRTLFARCFASEAADLWGNQSAHPRSAWKIQGHIARHPTTASARIIGTSRWHGQYRLRRKLDVFRSNHEWVRHLASRARRSTVFSDRQSARRLRNDPQPGSRLRHGHFDDASAKRYGSLRQAVRSKACAHLSRDQTPG